MESLKSIVDSQHKTIKSFREKFNKDINSESTVAEIKEWFYEFSIYLVYHFYTEEYFFDETIELDHKHITSHRQLLNQVYLVLLSKGDKTHLSNLINDFFDKYLDTHILLFDSQINYNIETEKEDYFYPDGYFGGFILVAFRKGYYTIGFGTLTEEVTKNYILDISRFDEKWMKFVDFTRWQYLTHDTLQAANEVNKMEMEHGLDKSFFTVNNDIAKYSVNEFLVKDQNCTFHFSRQEMLTSDEFKELLESDILDILVISSRSFIDGYYDQLLRTSPESILTNKLYR
jgi:hemerythrin